MNKNVIEKTISDLKAIEQILLHMASSEYLLNSPDAEICRFLSERINGIGEYLGNEIDKSEDGWD